MSEVLTFPAMKFFTRSSFPAKSLCCRRYSTRKIIARAAEAGIKKRPEELQQAQTAG